MNDPHRAKRTVVEERVLRGPGVTEPARRQAAEANQGLPEELRALVEKIHRHAYRVTDEDVAALRTRYPDDELFELIVSAALGAAHDRLDAALAALERA